MRTDTLFAAVSDLAVSSCGLVSPVVTEHHQDTIREAISLELTDKMIIEECRSAHQVAFGRLLKRREDKETGLGHLMGVAIKPFDDHNTAYNEVLGAMRLRELGVPTYDPIGIFPSRSGHHVVLSHKSDTLQGLDRDTWVVGRKVTTGEEAINAERNTRTIKEIAGLLAWLHVHGVFHPDGQIKNWGITPLGQIGAFDMERHVVRAPGHQDTAGLAWQDIEKLVASLVGATKESGIYGVGMLHGHSQHSLARACEELILQPYADRLMDVGLAGNGERAEQADLLLSGIEYRFQREIDQGWPSNYSTKTVKKAA